MKWKRSLHRKPNVKCQLQDGMKQQYGSITGKTRASWQPVAGIYVPFVLRWKVPLIYEFDAWIANVLLTLERGQEKLTLFISSAVTEQRQKVAALWRLTQSFTCERKRGVSFAEWEMVCRCVSSVEPAHCCKPSSWHWAVLLPLPE